MKKVYSLIIPTEPVVWKRARMGKGRFYDSQAHDKVAAGLYAAQQFHDDPIAKPCRLKADFYFKKPWQPKHTQCVGRGDIDNVVKFLLDMLVKAAVLQDDRYVVSLDANKLYPEKGTEPRTEIRIEML